MRVICKETVIIKILRNIGYIYRLSILRFMHGNHIKINAKIGIENDTEFVVMGQLVFKGVAQLSRGFYIKVAEKATVVIGNMVYFGRNCSIVARENVSIGDNCMFGPGVTIYDHNHFVENGVVKATEFVSERVSIGNNCWIGANAIILKGTKIGNNVVIAAGSVVKGEVDDNLLFYNKRTEVSRSIN